MPIELDPTLKKVILKVLDRYIKKPRFEEDCRALRSIVETGKTSHGRSIEGVNELKEALIGRCKEGLISNKTRWLGRTWTTKTENNSLYSDLCCAICPHFTPALVRENRQCLALLKAAIPERSKLLKDNRQLEKELQSTKMQITSLEDDNDKKTKRIEKLELENSNLMDKLDTAESEISGLKIEVLGLKEVAIPALKEELKEDFNHQLEEIRKQMADMKASQSLTPSEPTQQEAIQPEPTKPETTTQPSVSENSEKTQHIQQTKSAFFNQKTGEKNQIPTEPFQQPHKTASTNSTNPFDN